MPSSAEVEVVEYFDDLLVHLPFQEKLLIRGLILLLEVQPLVFNAPRPKLFSRATAEERYQNLRSWEKSSVFQRRLVFMAIRTLLLWAYVDSQEAERDMGLGGGGTGATERRNRMRLAAQLARSNASGPTLFGDPPNPPDSRDPAEKHA